MQLSISTSGISSSQEQIDCQVQLTVSSSTLATAASLVPLYCEGSSCALIALLNTVCRADAPNTAAFWLMAYGSWP
jgi:hypothetical protein